MAISDTLEEARAFLREIKKNYQFAKANAVTTGKVELQVSLAKCSGKLETCQKDFNRVIRNQSKNITAGLRIGADTMIQEQMLWDAAIGYMLVCDAIFALRTINSYDSAAHAYEMLDAAMEQITGKKKPLAKFRRIATVANRNSYGYVTSVAAISEKEELLESFFERLKVTGDIEQCLADARNPVAREAELRNAYTKGNIAPALRGEDQPVVSELDAYMNRLNNMPDAAAEDDFDVDFSAMMDIHPPKNDE